MTQDEKRYRLAEIQRSLAALPDELRTLSKVTLPDTAEREQVKAALTHIEAAVAAIVAALAPSSHTEEAHGLKALGRSAPRSSAPA